MNLIDPIKEVASVLDSQGRSNNRTLVRATRKHLMTEFKPKARGGQLYVGDHQIEIVGTGETSAIETGWAWEE